MSKTQSIENIRYQIRMCQENLLPKDLFIKNINAQLDDIQYTKEDETLMSDLDIKGELKSTILYEFAWMLADINNIVYQDAVKIIEDYRNINSKLDRISENILKRLKEDWRNNNFELTDLWKQVAVENSSISNTPEITANIVVDEFKKQFKL